LEENPFEYSFFNNEYCYRFGPLEVVNKKSYTVIVNHDDKIVAVVPKMAEKIKNKDLFSLAGFKKIIEEQKANIKVTRAGNEKILTLDSIQDPDIQGYRIYYSPQTYQVRKMLIGMVRLTPLDEGSESGQKSNDEKKKEKAKEGEENEDEGIDTYYYFVEINYQLIKPLSLHAGEFNPENKFVKINGNQIGLTREFEKYRLFNSEEP